jgi:hypothetical protein
MTRSFELHAIALSRGVHHLLGEARKRHRYLRQRIVRQLVCPRLSGEAGLSSIALARPGVDGRGRSLRHGVKFAHPDRPVIALVGDGAMQMNNMAELITVQKYWKHWADPRLVV